MMKLFSLLIGGPEGDPEVCGAMTSGGTESILSAVKATRDYMRWYKGIRQPQMIIAVSAHSAYFKAAEYFNIQLVKVCIIASVRFSDLMLALAAHCRIPVRLRELVQSVISVF